MFETCWVGGAPLIVPHLVYLFTSSAESPRFAIIGFTLGAWLLQCPVVEKAGVRGYEMAWDDQRMHEPMKLIWKASKVRETVERYKNV
jgi:hypothetical protein